MHLDPKDTFSVARTFFVLEIMAVDCKPTNEVPTRIISKSLIHQNF